MSSEHRLNRKVSAGVLILLTHNCTVRYDREQSRSAARQCNLYLRKISLVACLRVGPTYDSFTIHISTRHA
jgi:hypothetical protein